MKVERKIDMAASAKDIYQVVMDPDRLKDWVSIHERVKTRPTRCARAPRLRST